MGVRLSLAVKLLAAVMAAGAVMVAVLLGISAPQVAASFRDRGNVLVTASGAAMRELAADSTEASRAVLVDLIAHTVDDRRRTLTDLPLSLYGGDVDRMKAAIRAQDAVEGERLQRNVDLLAREMVRRATRRIDEVVGELAAEQRAEGERFAADMRRSYLVLAGGTVVVLVVLLGLGLFREVITPLRELRAATRAVARGDLSVTLRGHGGDEVGALTSDFAAMVEQLRSTRAQIQEAHRELQRWNDRLGAEVAGKTRHLEQALEDLRRTQRRLVHAEKMASVGTLAGGIAHEFNNLIGGIRGCAGEALAAEEDARRREPLEVIRRAADRAAAVTDQLLRFARQRVGAKEEVAVERVVGEALRLLEPEARQQGVGIVDLCGGGWTVRADGNALHQVFVNLVRNALEAMGEGGTLTVRVDGDDRTVRIEVADTGPGIAEEAFEKVFDPFYTTKEDGSGLGLAVSYGIVGAHGGALEARNADGGGAVFTVVLPRDGAGGDRG